MLNIFEEATKILTNPYISLIVFILIQFINVVLSTFKSIITVNGSANNASRINAISYTLAAVTTKFITQQNLIIIVVATYITNRLGVYLAKVIIDKRNPDKFWTINATLRTSHIEIEKQLQKRGVKYVIVPALNDRFLASIYSYSKAESALIKEILDKYNIKCDPVHT